MSNATYEPEKATRFRATPEEYLEYESNADEKHEWRDGEVVAMPGGTVRHAQVIANALITLGNALRGSKCRVYSSELRVRTPIFRQKQGRKGLYTYPDATVGCDEPDIEKLYKKTETLTNPTLLLEVLSDSTENHDRSYKLEKYATIESFSEYVLVSQHEARVEVFFQAEDGSWRISFHNGLDDVVELKSLGIQVTMKDLYDQVELDQPEDSEADNDESKAGS